MSYKPKEYNQIKAIRETEQYGINEYLANLLKDPIKDAKAENPSETIIDSLAPKAVGSSDEYPPSRPAPGIESEGEAGVGGSENRVSSETNNNSRYLSRCLLMTSPDNASLDSTSNSGGTFS